MIRRRIAIIVALAAAGAVLLAAGAARAGLVGTASGRRVVLITTRRVPKLGRILVDARGRTLYMFVPDKRRRVTCIRTCAALWPPVRLPRRARTLARGGARPALLGSDSDPAGGRVVTYNRWPLYTYVGDRTAGQTKGQALNLNGGLWYVLSLDGTVIRRKP